MKVLASRWLLVGALALGACGAALLAPAGAWAAPADKKADPAKDLEKALAATNKDAAVKALAELGAEGGEKAAKTILTIALNLDNLSKFKDADSNDIFDAAEQALAAVKDAKGEAFIFDQLKKHKDTKVRVFLCDVVGAKKQNPAAEDALIAAIDDKSSTVQRTAIQHLGLRKAVKAIDPIIALVAKVEKKKDEPWLEAVRFLTSISGKDLATAADRKSWWEGNKATFDPTKVGPTKTGAAGVGETVMRGAPDLFGTEVLSKRCVFILDVSGSMLIKDPKPEAGKGRPVSVSPKDPGYGDVPIERMRLHRLKEAMVKLIEGLPGGTRFTILTFGSSVRDWQPDLVDASAKNKADAADFANGMQGEGFTVTDEALRRAFDVGGEPDTFYLFSDGIPQRGKNADGTPQHIDRKEIMEEVEQMNRTRKVKIFTFGIGEADPNFMRNLATANGGTYTQID